eukprot:GFUD01066551.1.p1 GENE.GFUD01066551.1~~GFUD01066551.1.p1  ORF type:complete len:266 (-),score=59.80 GFUD01066551.1:66-863(-)
MNIATMKVAIVMALVHMLSATTTDEFSITCGVEEFKEEVLGKLDIVQKEVLGKMDKDVLTINSKINKVTGDVLNMSAKMDKVAEDVLKVVVVEQKVDAIQGKADANEQEMLTVKKKLDEILNMLLQLSNDGQCRKPFSILSQSFREIKYGAVTHETSECDKSLTPGWYQFREPAGLKLPLAPPPSHGKHRDTCGTAASAWVKNKEDPKVGEGIQDITICFAWGSECKRSVEGKAVACLGKDNNVNYLYFLPAAPRGTLAYCAVRD